MPGRSLSSSMHGSTTECIAHLCPQDAVLQRSFAVEPLAAVAASADGAYVAAGGASGSLYLWEAGSGRLVAQWPAHYKVRCRGGAAGGGSGPPGAVGRGRAGWGSGCAAQPQRPSPRGRQGRHHDELA